MTTDDVRTAAFTGKLYRTSPLKTKVGIVLIGGSEGRLDTADEIAPQLAALGHTVIGVNYHDGYSGPRKLKDVPIETFIAAADWLRKSGKADPRHIIVLGLSRGSEAALLTSTHDRTIAGTAVFVPSSVAWGSALGDQFAAWRYDGQPVGYVRKPDDGPKGYDGFAKALSTERRDGAAVIPVERIRGRLFVAGAEDDAVWPSALMARQIATRVKSRHGHARVTLLTYPNAGHLLLGTGPGAVTSSYTWQGVTYTSRFGGTEAGNLAARNASWVALQAFIADVARH